jgi:pilus assembly protein CpaF
MSVVGESTRVFLKPILEYLDDPNISEIMINGAKQIFIERIKWLIC